MKLTRCLCLLPAFVIVSSVAACSQSSDPVIALEELLSADKGTDASRHYPTAVEEVVSGLQGDEKAEAEKILLLKQKLPQNIAYKLRKTSEGGQSEAADESGDKRVTLTLLHSFVSGVDALIVTRLDFPNGGGAKKLFALRFEAGEWRLRSIGTWIDEENFESDKFVQGLLPTGRNETAAVETLVAIGYALLENSNADRGIGFPANLAVLSAPILPPAPEIIEKPDVPEVEEETSKETSDPVEGPADGPVASIVPEQPPLDPALMKNPAVKDGYEFRYNLINPGTKGEGGEYQVTATPVQFGKTGNKSFFMDQTFAIRFTTENRDANESDEPLTDEHDGPRLSFERYRIR